MSSRWKQQSRIQKQESSGSIRFLPFIALALALSVTMIATDAFARSDSACSREFDRVLKDATSGVTAAATGTKKFETLDDLLDAFNEGYQPDLTLKTQRDAFEIYRRLRFGDPKTYLNPNTLDDVVRELKRHPELKKEPFRNFLIEREEKFFPVTDDLKAFLDSHIKSSAQVRSNLFNIDANKGYWKKVLQYEEPARFSVKLEDKTARKALAKEADAHFKEFLKEKGLDRFNGIKKTDHYDEIRAMAKEIHRILAKERSNMIAVGKESKHVSQAITDLVHTIGYFDPLVQKNLKSSDGMLRIQAFRKVLDERDRFAMELGYPDHFKQVLERNRIGLPTGVDSEKGLSQRVRELESEIVSKAQSAPGPKQVKTLRHLSLNESPFRSCLGGSDCSSNTYLTRALDPNYHYFTLTDEAGLSSGHVTVVLGENSAKAEVARVAFIDKVQNVDSIELPEMIEAVRQSVEEKGYTLALPTKLGDHNGISNEAVTRQFIADQIKTDRSKLITGFSPHAHNYRFPNEFSRAELRLEMRPVMPLKLAKEVAIKPGKLVQPWKSAEFDLKKLAESTVELKNGSTRDRIRYISSMKTLERAGLKSDPEFQSTLESWIKDEQLPFALRKQVLITEWMDQHKKLPDLMTEFKGQERINLMQNLLDTPRFRNNVLSRKGDLPELIFHVRENQKLRTQLIREYMPGYETQISKILDAKDLDAYAATAAIKNIQTSLNAVDVDFVMQSKRAVAGSSVEPWVTTASAKAFIINTQGGSQLARGLEKTLQSNVREVKEFGESLVQIGSNPWGHPQPIVEIYRDLSQLQKAAGAQNLNEAAGQWLSKSDVPVAKKAIYLKSQMGVGDQRFESLVKSLPSAERKLVLKELKKGTNLDIYQKFAEKHGVESELFDHGVPESFQYQPIITAEEAKKGGVKFVMGEGKDARVVKLTKPFEMQATPMTQLQTVLLTGKNRSNFKGNGFELKINGKKVELDPRRPAEQYDWYDQNEIIRILNENDPNWNYRRPTEAEWEYAARAGSESNYSFGDQQDEMRYHGWSVESSGGKTQPVAQKRPNDFGLYDIHGNVNEWIEDYFAPLTPGKVTDPIGPQNGVTRVIRGGHFDEEPALIGFGNRGGVGAISKLDHAGFRLVREPK